MSYKRNSRSAGFKLFLPALAALLTMLLVNGSVANQARAGAKPPGVPTTANSSGDAETLVIRVYFRDHTQRDLLATELGAVEADTSGGYLTVWGDQAMYAELLARGLRVEIDQETTHQANNPYLFGEDSPDTFFGGYRTVEETFDYMDSLVAAYPNLAEKVDIGDSWCKMRPGECTQPNTWNGYDLWVLHITNRDIPGPKPVFWFETGIHPREIATSEMATLFMSDLLDQYGTNPDSRWLVDYHDIWVMPIVNPDGHHIVENGASNPRTQRKNARRDECNSYPPNDGVQLGTDVNRNFPFKWGCCGGSSIFSCDLNYRGPSASSEVETQAVTAKIRSLIADQRGPNDTDSAPITTTGIYQSMHTYAALNLYPWGWTGEPAPNGTDLGNIARHMSAPDADPPGNNYTACQPPNCLYKIDGDTADWGYGELGIPSYITELGPSGIGFFPPFSSMPARYGENRGVLFYMAKIARTPYLLTRGPDSNNVATNPMTVTQGTPAQLTASINYAWIANSYSQNVAAAEYYVDTPPWAGGTPIAMTPVDGTFNSPTEAVQATINTGSIAPGRHIIFVRGRGVNDYQGFQSWGPISAVWLTVVGQTITPSVTPVATATASPPLNTATPTPVPPKATRTATGTPTCCNSLTGGVLPDCFVATSGASNFRGIVEINNPCGVPLPATLQSYLEVSPGGSAWEPWAQTTPRPITIAPGPPPYSTQEFFSGQDIPTQYTHYRVVARVTETNACAVYTLISSPQQICRPVATGTVTPSATVPVEPTVTPTIGAPCGALLMGSSTSCTPPSTYNYSFTFYNESGCQSSATGTATLIFEAAPSASGPFDTLDTQNRSVTFPPGPGLVGFTGTMTETNIPAQYTVYRISFSAASVRAGAYGQTQITPLCNTGGGTVTVTPATAQPTTTSTAGTLEPTTTATESTATNTPGTIEPTTTGTPPTVEPTSTSCPLQFTDVPPSNTFYAHIRCLVCRGIISGYNDGTFRPNNDITRGQIAKIVSQSAGFSEPPGTRRYEDVPEASPFFTWIQRLSNRGLVGGYPCGLVPEEPCILPGNRPYFRPSASATRGQLSKIVASAKGINTNPTEQTYQDVDPTHTFYVWIEQLSQLGVMGGYPCGTVPSEPCGTSGKPYFRPANYVTRGQAAKIVANTFFPVCQTLVRR